MVVKILNGGDKIFLILRQEETSLEIDTGPSILVLTPLQAARLAGILDAWAEKGYLPGKNEVWK